MPLPCRKVQSTPIYPPGRGEIRDGWEAFSAQVALAILKGIDPNIHSSFGFHSLSLWRMKCTYHRPVGRWIGVKSIAALIYNANVHSRGKTKMKWMAGNECTPRSPSQFFFPRGESFGNYTAKTVGRADGRRVACSLHYMRELCNRSRTSERPRGRPELLPRAGSGREKLQYKR